MPRPRIKPRTHFFSFSKKISVFALVTVNMHTLSTPTISVINSCNTSLEQQVKRITAVNNIPLLLLPLINVEFTGWFLHSNP